ncbi:hypothetical protein IWZ01DRAFT_562010 [Phyllosticta capitalensis]
MVRTLQAFSGRISSSTPAPTTGCGIRRLLLAGIIVQRFPALALDDSRVHPGIRSPYWTYRSHRPHLEARSLNQCRKDQQKGHFSKGPLLQGLPQILLAAPTPQNAGGEGRNLKRRVNTRPLLVFDMVILRADLGVGDEGSLLQGLPQALLAVQTSQNGGEEGLHRPHCRRFPDTPQAYYDLKDMVVDTFTFKVCKWKQSSGFKKAIKERGTISEPLSR